MVVDLGGVVVIAAPFARSSIRVCLGSKVNWKANAGSSAGKFVLKRSGSSVAGLVIETCFLGVLLIDLFVTRTTFLTSSLLESTSSSVVGASDGYSLLVSVAVSKSELLLAVPNRSSVSYPVTLSTWVLISIPLSTLSTLMAFWIHLVIRRGPS